MSKGGVVGNITIEGARVVKLHVGDTWGVLHMCNVSKHVHVVYTDMHTIHLQHTWHDGTLRKVTIEELIIGCDVFVAHCVFLCFELHHAVDQQKGVPMVVGMDMKVFQNHCQHGAALDTLL